MLVTFYIVRSTTTERTGSCGCVGISEHRMHVKIASDSENSVVLARSRGSSVSIVPRLWNEQPRDQGQIPDRALYTIPSRPVTGGSTPHPTPIQQIPRGAFLGHEVTGKQPTTPIPRRVTQRVELHLHSPNTPSRRGDLFIDIFVNCNWVVTRQQQYSTHLHTNNTQNDTKQTIHRTTQQFWKSAGSVPSWLVISWHLPYNRGKAQGNPNLCFSYLTLLCWY